MTELNKQRTHFNRIYFHFKAFISELTVLEHKMASTKKAHKKLKNNERSFRTLCRGFFPFQTRAYPCKLFSHSDRCQRCTTVSFSLAVSFSSYDPVDNFGTVHLTSRSLAAARCTFRGRFPLYRPIHHQSTAGYSQWIIRRHHRSLSPLPANHQLEKSNRKTTVLVHGRERSLFGSFRDQYAASSGSRRPDIDPSRPRCDISAVS